MLDTNRIALLLLLPFLLLLPLSAQLQSADMDILVERTPVPELPPNGEWLNVAKPLSMESLKGRFVLLDFWSYSCINCLHAIPDLHRLNDAYGELSVIGVHSGKFRSDQDFENIRNAVLRHEITHPVIVDRDMTLWHQYAIKTWPSFVLIDPAGYMVAKFSGDGVYKRLQPVLDSLIAEYDGEWNTKQLPLQLERTKRASSYLAFPSGLAAAPEKKRLYVSDTNHNRILEIGEDSTVTRIFGSGLRGRNDGPASIASFHRPRGLAFDAKENMLYVADTENHLIRKIDLNTDKVSTLLGTGTQAMSRNVLFGKGDQLALNSPWGLALDGRGNLLIAMAGSHQIWRLDLSSKEAAKYIGSGWEALRDGPLPNAQLAQPTAMTYRNKNGLYFVDSESSAIRMLADNTVSTLIGTGLFDYGDHDGAWKHAKLQHPMGICSGKDGKLYITDTYNHKIKVINVEDQTIRTLVGSGNRGWKDGIAHEAELNEPQQLAWVNDKLYFTDTNNDLIRWWDPQDNFVYSMGLKHAAGLSLLERKRQEPSPKLPFYGQTILLQPQFISPEGEPAVQLNIQLPAGYIINEAAPNYADAHELLAIFSLHDKKTLSVGVVADPLPEVLTVEAGIYFCDERKDAKCFIKQFRFEIPLMQSKDADQLLMLEHKLNRRDFE